MNNSNPKRSWQRRREKDNQNSRKKINMLSWNPRDKIFQGGSGHLLTDEG